jgi:hypothetical protein
LEAKAMEYKPETKTVSFKSTPYHFSKERENKHYTCRLMSMEDYDKLTQEDPDYIRLSCSNSRDNITREVIDITCLGELLGKMLVGIGWRAQ